MEHFIHPGHSLSEVYGSEEFHCDRCKTPGNGPRYRCHTCDFNVHDYCRRCPFTLSTFMHPQHHLELVNGTQGRHDNRGSCDLCGDNVEGMFYRCKLCDFNIHPLCTQLPEYVPHALHPVHQLKLQKSSHGPCSVCKIECTSWRYGCRTCSFDIHLECILTRCDASTASRSVAAPAPPHGVASPLLPWGWGWGCSALTPHSANRPAPYGAYWPAPYGAYGPDPYGAYGPSPHASYRPSPYSTYGPQHPYCSSTPPYYYSSGPPPTHFGAHVYPYGFAPPPPTYGAAPPPTYGAAAPPPTYVAAAPPPTYGAAPPAPSHGAYAYGDLPGFSPDSVNHSVSEAEGSGKPSKLGKRLGKIIYSLVANLTVGLLCGIIFI